MYRLLIFMALAAALLLPGCGPSSSNYSLHYLGMSHEEILADDSLVTCLEPESMTQNELDDMTLDELKKLLESVGYEVVGYSTFVSSGRNSLQAAYDHAVQLGACIHTYGLKYAWTNSGMREVKTPVTTSEEVKGRVENPDGSRSRYTETITTTVEQVDFEPYSYDWYRFTAVYGAMTKWQTFGLGVDSLPEEVMRKADSRDGVVVTHVINYSEAAGVDFRLGDVIRTLNGRPVNKKNVGKLLKPNAVNRFTLTRDGKTLEKEVFVPAYR